MKIHEWTQQATTALVGVGIGTARLDVELILSHTLKKPRTWLHMYRDEPLPTRFEEIAESRLALRFDRVPLAYIIGHKEFYGRRFKVTPATLIPRPESEAIIEIVKELLPNTQLAVKNTRRLIDIGTGSGCLGITAKLECPELDVTLADISKHALNVAEENARVLNADVTVIRSDLLQSYPFTPDIILANLPYVDPGWQLSPELVHEPQEALFADDEGLSLIKKLIVTFELQPLGTLLLEADTRQHEKIIAFARAHQLHHVQTRGLILHFSPTADTH